MQGRPGRRAGRGLAVAHVIDVEVIRKVTEWALPGLEVPVLRDGHVRGAAAGRVRRFGVLRGGAERRRGGADRVRERAARAGRAGDGQRPLGVPVSPGWVDKASARLAAQLGRAGFDAAMLAALAGEKALAADETPVNVLDKDASQRPAREDGEEGIWKEKEKEKERRLRVPRTC